MKLKNALLEWITFTLIFFFLYDVIWAVIDIDTFKRFLTETYIKGILLDLLYCGLFSLVSLLITGGLLRTRLFREAENNRKKFLAGSVIILTANTLLAGICEFFINVAFPRYALEKLYYPKTEPMVGYRLGKYDVLNGSFRRQILNVLKDKGEVMDIQMHSNMQEGVKGETYALYFRDDNKKFFFTKILDIEGEKYLRVKVIPWKSVPPIIWNDARTLVLALADKRVRQLQQGN